MLSVQQVEADLAHLLEGYHKLLAESRVMLAPPIFSGAARCHQSGGELDQPKGKPKRRPASGAKSGAIKNDNIAPGHSAQRIKWTEAARANTQQRSRQAADPAVALKKRRPATSSGGPVIVASQLHVCGFGGPSSSRHRNSFYCPACSGSLSSRYVRFLHREDLHATLQKRHSSLSKRQLAI